MPTTAIPNTAKVELLKATHCTLVTKQPAASAGSNAAFTLTGLSDTTDIATGMFVTGTNVGAAPNYVTSIDSATAVHVSVANTGTVTSGTVVFTADTFKLALIKAAASGTYDKNVTNAGVPGTGAPTTANLGTDEIAASGSYSTGGVALTNVTPILSTDTACGSFGNVTITSATISTIGCEIYNTIARLGHSTYAQSANRVIYVGDFGGTQTVTSGTMTLTMPTQNSSSSLLRIA
jgi:hypothetical protein